MSPAWPVWRLLGVCAIALTTANCANNPQRYAAGAKSDIDPKYGVKASRRVYNEGDTIPKGGGRRFSGKPYVVAGRTYVPRDEGRGYVREGLASWYGAAFHGRVTANGEVFDRHSIAAAHPTLPLPSYARVTNLDNGHSMVVRVNDRGPYHANRVMDVSEETARALDFHRRGTAHVRVEYVGKASTAGSDDRKLLATLRTDGRPAAAGPRVMVADLGPDAPDDLARSSSPPLAFKPSRDTEEVGEAPARRPSRPAPVVVAAATPVSVPAAVQPNAARKADFQRPPTKLADFEPAQGMRTASHGPALAAPISLAPPPIRLAGATPERNAVPARKLDAGRPASTGIVAAASTAPAPLLAGKPASRTAAVSAIPADAKVAMAKLAAASGALASAGQKGAVPTTKAKPRDRVAAAY